MQIGAPASPPAQTAPSETAAPAAPGPKPKAAEPVELKLFKAPAVPGGIEAPSMETDLAKAAHDTATQLRHILETNEPSK